MVENIPDGKTREIGSQLEETKRIGGLGKNLHPELPEDTTPQQEKPKLIDPFKWGVYSAIKRYVFDNL